MKRYKHVEVLLKELQLKRGAIQKRLNDFKNILPQLYFYELLYCLMTPQSSAMNAHKAQKKFEDADFLHSYFHPELILSQKEHYIRFHKTKSRWISEMKLQFDNIHGMLIRNITASAKREWLVKNVKGLGYKEASHFLRNIGLNNECAILDRHILKNLKYHGVIRTIPKTLSKAKYFLIEKYFKQFAQTIGVSVDELDLLFWSNETGEILK